MSAYRREVLLPVIGGEGTPFEAEFMIHRAIQQSGGEIHVASQATVAHESWQTVWEACLANGSEQAGSRIAPGGAG